MTAKSHFTYESNFDSVLRMLEAEALEKIEQIGVHLQGAIKTTLTGQRSGRRYVIPGLKTIRFREEVLLGRKVLAKQKKLGRDLTNAEYAGIESPKLSKKQREKRKYTASAPGEPPAVLTGRLRNSIKYKVEGSGMKLRVLVGSPMDKAPWLEFGTSRIKPRPFLKPTYEREKGRVKSILEGRWMK